MGKVTTHQETAPHLLAAYALEAAVHLWPECHGDYAQTARQYEDRYGVATRLSVFRVATDRSRALAFLERLIRQPLAPEDRLLFGLTVATEMDSSGTEIRRPFVDRWLCGAAEADTVTGMALVLGLVAPAINTPQGVRAGGWSRVGPVLWRALAAQTGIQADTWRDVFNGRREARKALEAKRYAFLGFHHRYMTKWATLFMLHRVPGPGEDYPLTLSACANWWEAHHPEDSQMEDHRIAEGIAPFDAAFSVPRGVTPHRPKS